MPRPAQRSRSFRKLRKKMPSGRYKMHYVKKKPGMARCAVCRKPLHGVARGRENALKKLTKSEKRPTRPYAGNLCSSCMRSAIREKVQ